MRYVADFHDAIEARAFERALDEFVGLVLARLDAVGLSGTELRLLWDDVLAKRAGGLSNPTIAAFCCHMSQ